MTEEPLLCLRGRYVYPSETEKIDLIFITSVYILAGVGFSVTIAILASLAK